MNPIEGLLEVRGEMFWKDLAHPIQALRWRLEITLHGKQLGIEQKTDYISKGHPGSCGWFHEFRTVFCQVADSVFAIIASSYYCASGFPTLEAPFTKFYWKRRGAEYYCQTLEADNGSEVLAIVDIGLLPYLLHRECLQDIIAGAYFLIWDWIIMMFGSLMPVLGPVVAAASHKANALPV